MVGLLLRPLRLLAAALTDEDAPRELALGLALGVLLGLVPKGNLTAGLLMAVLLCLRANLAGAFLSAFVFSWIAALLDPLTHQIGLVLLHATWLQVCWERFFALPLVPWTNLNNTVVLGSLVIGLLAFWPCYWLFRRWTERFVPIWAERLKKYKIGQLLLGTELVTSWRSV